MDMNQEQFRLFTTLNNPFDRTINDKKLGDGRENATASVTFRACGDIKLYANGSYGMIMIYPGFNHVVAWCRCAPGSGNTHGPIPFPKHIIEKQFDIYQCRIVSTGLKLSCMNSEKKMGGTWEAIRVPIKNTNWWNFGTISGNTTYPLPTFMDKIQNEWEGKQNFSDFPIYASGNIADLDNYMFKLNSNTNEHEFITLEPGGNRTGVTEIDNQWDIVVIRLLGNTVSNLGDVAVEGRTLIKWEICTNQEIVYREPSSLSRLMTPSKRIDGCEEILKMSNWDTPCKLF
jgi:hypothetical protein